MKRAIALAAVLTLVATPAFGFIRGDADGDGNFNALIDGLFIFQYGFIPGSPVPPCLDAADVDDSGNVAPLTDGFYLLNFGFVPGSPPPPAPFPGDGPDPTPDPIPDGDCGVFMPPMLGDPITIERACCSQLPGDTTGIVHTAFSAAEWQVLWQMHSGGQQQTPPVDFTTDIVVMVVTDFFNGTHEVTIDSLEDIGTDIVVNFTVRTSNLPPCAALIVPTQPFHAVVWPNANLVGVSNSVIDNSTLEDVCDPPALCNSGCP